MSKKALTTTGLIIAVALFLAVHALSTTVFRTSRIDLTENNLYTLSDGTKNILSSIEEPITLRFYISQSLMSEAPAITNYAGRVQEMLEEYSRYAGDNLNLLIIDPEPFSEEEDQAVSFGLQGVPLNEGADTFYFGLAGTNALDNQESIGFFTPERSEFLEYDLTKLIYQLANPEQQTIGIMSTLPIEGGGRPTMPGQRPPQAWLIVEQIKQLFDVKTVGTDIDFIPKDVALLMIVHPKNLPPQTQYAIDQFVMEGGRVIAFVDAYAEAQPTPPGQNFMANANKPRNSELDKLLKSWGVEMVKKKVAADRATALQVQFSQGKRPVLYPVYMDVQPTQYNDQDIITKNLDHMVFASPGILNKIESAETEFTPLIQTTTKAMKVDASKLGIFAQPEELMRNYRPEGQLTIAARITGKMKTAFPDGRPKAGGEDKSGDDEASDTDANENKDAPTGEHLTESKEPTNILVVADVDFLQDRYWARQQNFLGRTIIAPTAANLNFVTNALENLVGSNDLISVRNRGTFNRPFTKVRELRQEAEQQFLQKANMLKARLRETENKLKQLEVQKGNQSSQILTDEQKDELKKFMQERVSIGKELRKVQHSLNKDIENLEAWVMFFNIGLIPLLIIVGGVVFAVYRLNKSSKPREAKSS